MKLRRMQENADKAEALLKALASRNRLMILCMLVEGERSVEALGVRESVIYRHLGLSRRDGLVQGRRDGQTIHYGLAGEHAKRLLTTLYEIFCTDDGPDPDPTG
jgi:DNA-binding transcriptional ArsR family regulator